MFSGFMTNAWIAATVVAIVAGVVGFFVVLRGASFVAHAVPQGAFAGAAGASLIGVNTILGLTTFSLLASLCISVLGRRGRHDVTVALTFVLLLGLGSLFLSFSSEYEPEVFSLLFGEVLGVASTELQPVFIVAAVSIIAIAIVFRPLLFASTLPDNAHVRGVNPVRMEMVFLTIVALATSLTLPIVGALLIFSLMIGPPASARALTSTPLAAVALSVALCLATVWAAIAASYLTNWPVGFFVGTFAAASYVMARGWARFRQQARRVPLAPGMTVADASQDAYAHEC